MTKKFLRGLAIILVLILSILVIFPIVFKTRINNWVKSQISAGFNARVDYASVSITWFRHFPEVDVAIAGLALTGDSLFKEDTLASFKSLDLTLDFYSLWHGSNYKILQCSLHDPVIKLEADSLGRSNWNILKQVSVIPGIGMVHTSDTSHVTLQIDHYQVINASVSFEDHRQQLSMFIRHLEFSGSVQASVIAAAINIGDISIHKAAIAWIDKANVKTELHYNLNTDNLQLDTLNALTGKTSLQGSGTMTHVLAGQMLDSTFVCRLNLHAGFFDLNNWLESTNKAGNMPKPAGFAPKQSARAASTSDSKKPAHQSADVLAVISFDTIALNKLLLQNARALIHLQQDSIDVSEFSCHMLGGSAKATLSLANRKDVRMNIHLQHCDMQSTCNAVPLTDKIAPVARYLRGTFSASMQARGRLNDSMSLDYNTLAGDGKIETSKCTITQVPVLTDIATLAKNAKLENLELNPVTSTIHCKNSTVTVDPTSVSFANGFNLQVKGSNTFAGQINYLMQLAVPTKKIGGIASMAQSFLSGIPGLNIKIPEVMTFDFDVTGTFAKPQAKLVNMKAGN